MQTTVEEELFCVNHPKEATLLRCSKCLNPMCGRCAVRTPVGWRCPDCTGAVAGRTGYYVPTLLSQVTKQQYLKTIAAMLGVAIIGGIAWGQFRLVGGWGDWSFWFVFAISLVSGEVVGRISNERRNQQLMWIASAGVVLAAIVALLWTLMISNELAPSQWMLYLGEPLSRRFLGLTLPNGFFVVLGALFAAQRVRE
ncbi:hypothetical protein ACP8Y2_14200 [Herpetosiphon llansteffanensis]